MKFLFLGPGDSPVLEHLRSIEHEVEAAGEPVDPSRLAGGEPWFLVSHGYRHILSREVLEQVPDRAVNLHISYLPWNRGADPNFWSFVEGTPKGVSIHYIDEGVDTGDIIVQREVRFGEGETLASSYGKLQDALLDLFRRSWPSIREGTCSRTVQAGGGTCHLRKDMARHRNLLVDGWETPASELEAYGARAGLRRR